MRRRWLCFALCTLVVVPCFGLEVPSLDRRVIDLAGLFSASAASSMEAELEGLETETGAQVAVLTIPSLEGQPLEDYALRVVEAWRLGREKRDNGVLILIARDDRKIRIEVGYGLEGVLPDAMCGRIIDNAFRSVPYRYRKRAFFATFLQVEPPIGRNQPRNLGEDPLRRGGAQVAA